MPPTRAVLSSSPSIVGRAVEVVEEEVAVGTEVIGTVEVAVETAEGLIMLVVDGEVGSVQLRIYGRSMQKKVERAEVH